MKRCIFLLLGSAGAANLRRNHGPELRVGIGGSIDDRDSRERNVTRTSGASLTGEQPQPFKLVLSNHKGVQYTAPVSLDKQTLMAVYDTGSFEIMAISRLCKVCSISSSLTTYDNRNSQSYKEGHRPIEDHHFAGGVVTGRQDFETVHVGDLDSVFQVKDMAFWQIVSTDMPVWTNKKATFTAIVGLGHRGVVPDTPEDGQPMDSVIERTGTRRFSICLVRGPANPGYIVFNPPYDLGLSGIGSMFRRVPVIGKNHWAVSLNSVSTIEGSKTTQACVGGEKCIAIVDSGTSLIGVPPNAVNMVYDVIKQVKPDCSNLDELPELVFELGGQKFSMPGSAYTVQFGAGPGNPGRCLPAFTDFAMTSDQGTVWILGMPFLRHFYTIFDREEPSIYVAEQGENCEPAEARNGTAATGAFWLNSTGLAADSQTKRAQLTLADVSEARLPSWANGQKHIVI